MRIGDYNATETGRGSSPRRLERRLAAILGADIMSYSALMERNEEETHERVGAELERFRHEIEKSDGRVFAFAGDGLMAEFPSAVEALKCSLRVQAESSKRNAALPVDQRIIFRIGINSGELVLQRGRTGGTAVNIAARLEQIAEPGGICLSGSVFEQVRRIVAASYEFLGEQRLKNIRDPLPVYGIRPAACGNWAGMPVLRRLSGSTIPDAGPIEPAVEYRPSLAVLPFRTLQKDQSDAYFAEGMVDDIIRVLGGLKELVVIARSSTLMFARAPLDLRRIGHELDVRYVLHGSVRRAGGMLRIAVELSEAPSGQVIWADRFEGDLSDLFELQDRIAMRVVTAIAPHLRERELSRAIRKHPASMTAYDLTLQALDLFYRMDRASIAQARELLEQAAAHDPDYGPAYSHMASLHMRLIGQGWSEDVMADRAKAANAARSAIERDRNDAVALAIYGHVQSYLMKDYLAGTDYLNRALAVGPSCAWAWGYSSLTSGYLGDYETAVARAENGVRLSPIGPDAFWLEHYLSQAYYLVGRYEDAVGWGRMSSAHAEANTSNLRSLIASLVALGDIDEARTVAAHLLQLAPTFGLANFRMQTPLRGEVRDLFAERLKLAGVPE
jgi:TolB-like protein/class 3 adenylate cyclase/tetratricopeptide (TPR) repeat protein